MFLVNPLGNVHNHVKGKYVFGEILKKKKKQLLTREQLVCYNKMILVAMN